MNKIILIGNVVKEVEVQFLNSGTAMVKNTIAVQRKFKNKDGNQTTDFLNFVIFGKQAEVFADYVLKGHKVALTGRMEQNSYNDKEGKKVYSYNVAVEEFSFLEKKGQQKCENFEEVSEDIPF